jgi:predicted transcriptional regulator
MPWGFSFCSILELFTGVSLGRNRDRLRIVAAILEAANSGSSKTRIMFSANLSFKLLEKYLGLAVSAGFVQVHDSVYLLTESGHEFLKQYSDFHERYAKAQEQIEALDSEHEKLAKLCERRGLGSLA